MEAQVSHVLYISTDCKVCHALRARGIPSGVRVENVVDIIPRPAWLDGTPTMVDVSVGVLYKGSDALIVMEHMRQTQTQQAQQQAQQIAQAPPAAAPSRPGVPAKKPQAVRPEPPEAAAPPLLLPANAPSTPSDWRSRFKTSVSDAEEEETPKIKINEASIAEMMSKRAMKMPPQARVS